MECDGRHPPRLNPVERSPRRPPNRAPWSRRPTLLLTTSARQRNRCTLMCSCRMALDGREGFSGGVSNPRARPHEISLPVGGVPCRRCRSLLVFYDCPPSRYRSQPPRNRVGLPVQGERTPAARGSYALGRRALHAFRSQAATQPSPPASSRPLTASRLLPAVAHAAPRRRRSSPTSPLSSSSVARTVG